jgi:hypothetical protein
MSDDDDKPDDKDGSATATGAAGVSPEAQERMFSQDALDAIVAKRVAKAEKAAERRVRSEYEAQNSTAQKKDTQPTQGSDDIRTELAELKAKAAYAEAIAELDWKPSKTDAELLRDAFKSGGEASMQKLAGRLKPATQQPAQEQNVNDASNDKKYQSPGAPSGAPVEVLDRDATKWSKDYIERMRGEGTFLKELEKFRNSLPGGGGSVFRKRIPKVS